MPESQNLEKATGNYFIIVPKNAWQFTDNREKSVKIYDPLLFSRKMALEKIG